MEEELDYELEAQNQRTLARIFRGHPFIVVPDVVTSLSREQVLVSEFVEGTGFEELKSYPQTERDRIGEILFRFYFGCLYRHHQFSGDPTPATRCCSTTAGWRSSTSGCSSGCRRARSSSRSRWRAR